MKVLLTVLIILLSSFIVKCYYQDEATALNKVKIVRSIFKSMSTLPAKDQFKAYHYLQQRSYDLNSQEGLTRYKIFKNNLKFIQETNASNPGLTLGLNDSADLTLEEYKERFLMKPQKDTPEIQNEESYFDKYADTDDTPVDTDLAADADYFVEVSWLKYKTPTRDQRYCGSCWAFASTTVVATNYLKNYGEDIGPLSPQYHVDCDLENMGCDGGFPLQVFRSMRELGVTPEANYPYVSGQDYYKPKKRENCKNDVPKMYIVQHYDSGRDKDIKYFFGLLTKGPLYASMDAGSDKFRFYQGGVVDLPDCYSTNHAVVAMGAIKENGENCLLIQNSYGSSWGDNGMMKLKYRKDFGCQLVNSGILPILKRQEIPQPPKPDNKCVLIYNDCSVFTAQKFETCESLPTLPIKVEKSYKINTGKFKGSKVYLFDEENCSGGKLYYDGEETCFDSKLKSLAIIPSDQIKPDCLYAFENGCMLGNKLEICNVKKYDFNGFKVGSIILGANLRRAKLISQANSSIGISEKLTFAVYSDFYQKVKSVEIQ